MNKKDERQIKLKRIRELTMQLNAYRDSYYNKSESIISDYEYDNLFDELARLEKESDFYFSNSPTKNVGYEVKSKLEKVKHNHPMLSLDKTKSVSDLIKFKNNKPCVLMLKMDGLTISLRYLDGELISAESRGNGDIGEDVLHTVKTFSNVPLSIDYKDELIVDGEAIIDYDTFDEINRTLPEENKYKNPRNLSSGSVRQLDSKVAASRNIKFIAWKCVKGFYGNDFADKLICLQDIGFDVVPFEEIGSYYDMDEIEHKISSLKEDAEALKYPIDGMVLGYSDIEYGESLGMTGHHLRSQIAYKFYDEEVETELLSIDWTIGKTGILTPTAVFSPVEIDGTTVERASLHNISICRQLQLGIGDMVTVKKCNMIIPQVADNLTRRNTFQIPHKCPICGESTNVVKDNDTEVLVCTNDNCKGKLLGKLTHAVSRNALNIDGLSEATIEKFISLGWISSIKDIYHLSDYADKMKTLEGFGKKSADKLLKSIEDSRKTTLGRFIYALSIPLCGKTASKEISKYYKGDFTRFIEDTESIDWTKLDVFGDSINYELNHYFLNNKNEVRKLAEEFVFENNQNINSSSSLSGKTFVITGLLHHFTNRDEAKERIETMGGKVSGSVSANTFALVNNDISSTSSKNKRAKELGIKIITEEQLLEMLN